MVSLLVKDKTIVFYDNMLSPDVIRLVSEKLCLDHTIQIKASSQRISYVELIRLHETNIFDKILFCGTNLYFRYPKGCVGPNEEMERMDGYWFNMDDIILVDDREDELL